MGGPPDAEHPVASGHAENPMATGGLTISPAGMCAGACCVGFETAILLGLTGRPHAYWTQAQFLLTQGFGHRRILRDPEIIGRAVRFLEPTSTTERVIRNPAPFEAK